MLMTTNFQLMDEVDVRPAAGLACDSGMVRIVGITMLEAVPSEQDVESYMTGDDEWDSEMKAGVWYGLRYLDESVHVHYGIIWLPEVLFQELVNAAL